MDYKHYCQVLGIDEPLTIDILKRHYRMSALQYHPDKNKDPGSAAKFHEISEAYEYLLTHLNHGSPDSENGSYKNMLASFLETLLSSIGASPFVDSIIQKILLMITNTCENQAILILEKLDKRILVHIIEILSNYGEVLHLSKEFLEQIRQILIDKINRDECIVLNPFIDDLLENNLYKLVENGRTYMIPLWHHELVYDNSGCDLYVKCSPILPENMEIDDDNNLHIWLKYKLCDVFEQTSVIIEVGSRRVEFDGTQLRLMKNQLLVLKRCGISRIDVDEIYNVSRTGDLILHVELSMD